MVFNKFLNNLVEKLIQIQGRRRTDRVHIGNHVGNQSILLPFLSEKPKEN